MEKKKLAEKISPQQLQDFPIKVMDVDPQGETVSHCHDFVEIVLIERGAADHHLEGHVQRVKSGDILIIARGWSHAYTNCTADFALINLLFIPEVLSLARLDSYLLPGFKILMEQAPPAKGEQWALSCPPCEWALLLILAREMLHEDQNRTPGYLFNMRGAFMVILGHIARLLAENNTQCRNTLQPLSGAIAHLNKHFKAPLDIGYLCRISGLSRPSFQRNFVRATGTTPLQYQLKLRLTEAAMMLRISERSLSEIAFAVGFNDANYLCRLFKKQMGISPGQYRKQCALSPVTGVK